MIPISIHFTLLLYPSLIKVLSLTLSLRSVNLHYKSSNGSVAVKRHLSGQRITESWKSIHMGGARTDDLSDIFQSRLVIMASLHADNLSMNAWGKKHSSQISTVRFSYEASQSTFSRVTRLSVFSPFTDVDMNKLIEFVMKRWYRKGSLKWVKMWSLHFLYVSFRNTIQLTCIHFIMRPSHFVAGLFKCCSESENSWNIWTYVKVELQ